MYICIYAVLFESPKTTHVQHQKKYNTNSDIKCSVSLHHTHRIINIVVVSGSYTVSTGTPTG